MYTIHTIHDLHSGSRNSRDYEHISWRESAVDDHLKHDIEYSLCDMQKMDPQIYKLLEVSYEAWIDSGIDVRALRDSNRVGVYTGTCGSEVTIFTYLSATSSGSFSCRPNFVNIVLTVLTVSTGISSCHVFCVYKSAVSLLCL